MRARSLGCVAAGSGLCLAPARSASTRKIFGRVSRVGNLVSNLDFSHDQ